MEHRSLTRKAGRIGRRIRRGHPFGISFFLLTAVLIGLFFIKIVRDNLGLEERPIDLGATFSKWHAESLGLPWKQAYTDMLDDLGVRLVRIPVYWNDIEPEPGVFNFSNVDWQVREAEKRGARVILAVGRKLPRWPECHVPAWARDMEEALAQPRILAMVEKTVRRYASYPSVIAWQVENEPFFEFGICPPADRAFLKHEVAVVRALDDRPIVISESGELSTWVNAASIADILGISTYRVVWDKYVGYFYWPVTPKYYTRRAAAVTSLVDDVIITELQAEPWVTVPIDSMPVDEQLKIMNPERLRENVLFARRIGFPQAYFWGVEWWYWLKTKGHPEMWETGKRLIGTSGARKFFR